MAREASHMHFVDDGPGGGTFQRDIAFPIVRRGSTTTLFIAVAACCHPCCWQQRGYTVGNHDSATIGVDQKFGRLETALHALDRMVREREPIDLPWSNIRDEGMPVVIGAVEAGSRAMTCDGFASSA